MEGYSHFDESGRPVMVDVSAKKRTLRRALAECFVELPEAVYNAVREGPVAKGDPLRIAEVGGIMAAKRTPDLIPLCHPISLDSVRVRCEIEEAGRRLRVECEAIANDSTGVEMEALTGASVAALVFYDMCKALGKGMTITGARLLEKTGGRSGNWRAGENKSPGEETRCGTK